MTENIMELFSDALQRYAAANGKLPDTLHALPLREDIRAWIWKDGWGEAIRYEHNGNGGYTLSSSLPFRPGSAASVAVPVVDPADDDTSMDVSNTIANMELLDVAISRYLKQTGHLPAKLSDLPEPASIGVPYETTDGWGGPISYAKDSDENFELSAIRTTAAGRQYHFSRKDVEVRGTTEPTTMRGGQ